MPGKGRDVAFGVGVGDEGASNKLRRAARLGGPRLKLPF